MRSLTKTLSAAACTALLASCTTTAEAPGEAVTEAGFTPPPVGTEIDWTFVYGEGDSDESTSRVVATGQDFAIYLSDTSYGGSDPFDYYVEFSGVFFTMCDGPMPSAAEREAALALWPLAAGNSSSVSGDWGGDVIIGEQASILVGKGMSDVVWTDFSYTEDGTVFTDKSAVSLELGTVVEMRWDDGALDLVRAIRPGTADPGTVLVDKPKTLGNCAALIKEN
ncbi:MAG: hypothetical protein AAF216_10755 [Pseudomonadota bacterium]